MKRERFYRNLSLFPLNCLFFFQLLRYKTKSNPQILEMQFSRNHSNSQILEIKAQQFNVKMNAFHICHFKSLRLRGCTDKHVELNAIVAIER